jgi:hypothetical protein
MAVSFDRSHQLLRGNRRPLEAAPEAGEQIQLAGVPSRGVNPPAPPPRRSRGGARTSGDRLRGWCCKGWAGPFPWFEYHLNQTNHAHQTV